MHRIAIVGCGAVAEKYHMPIIAGHEKAKLSALVDQQLARARGLADAYNVPLVFQDVDEVDRIKIDAAIVCTPPKHHAVATLNLLRKGIHVLVEKPIATNAYDAEQMIRCADENNAILSVAVFRRLLPSLKLLKKAIDEELLGPVQGFHVQGGAVYGWEAVSLGNMLKSQAGGGVLMDMGPHYLDQLLYLFDGPSEVVEYQDDSLGGIEANCIVKLKLLHRGQRVSGTLEISRTHTLRNEFVVICRDGELVIPPSDRYRVLIRKKDWKLSDREGSSGDAEFSIAWNNEPETSWLKNYRDEIDDWLYGIETKTQPKLSGRSTLPVMQLIDRCYQLRKPIHESWQSHPLITAPFNSAVKIQKTNRRVLITGASGFIGCRLAEILSQRGGYEVRAVVHNPANASRIARLPVELVQANLANTDDAIRITQQCDTIIHCAIGTDTGNRKSVFDVTVGGTKNLLLAAQRASIDHFIHLSTIAVHPEQWCGIIDEHTPTDPQKGNTYGESKLAAENVVQRNMVPYTIFRPGCVYGPYGKTFIINPIRAMLDDRLILSGSASTPSNTVYVDSLCEAIILSMESSNCRGKIYTLADDDGTTWSQFYGYFAERFNLRFQIETTPHIEGAFSAKRQGVLSSLKQIGKSDEAKALIKAIAWQTPIGSQARQWLEGRPKIKRSAKRLAGLGMAAIYKKEAMVAEKSPLRIFPRLGVICSDLVRRELGWKPMIPRQQCLQFVGDWLEYSQMIPDNHRTN